MISKELLSEVLGWRVDDIKIGTRLIICIQYCGKNGVTTGRTESFNIYELAHNKCKEWARDKFSLEVFTFTLAEDNYEVRVLRSKERDLDEYVYSWWNIGTEPEAIFKACEYIMEIRNDK